MSGDYVSVGDDAQGRGSLGWRAVLVVCIQGEGNHMRDNAFHQIWILEAVWKLAQSAWGRGREIEEEPKKRGVLSRNSLQMHLRLEGKSFLVSAR